jgi:hypothetical protein
MINTPKMFGASNCYAGQSITQQIKYYMQVQVQEQRCSV